MKAYLKPELAMNRAIQALFGKTALITSILVARFRKRFRPAMSRRVARPGQRRTLAKGGVRRG
jgi:hypothetical protein